MPRSLDPSLTEGGCAPVRLISKKLEQRSNYRRGRRSRNLRYRAPRFNNRTKPKGWLAPSLRHRVDTTMSLVTRLRQWAPVAGVAQELVRFDMAKMENPEITGAEYRQGTLAGYETREPDGSATPFRKGGVKRPRHLSSQRPPGWPVG